ncbi:type IV pilin-like G/H family protein [Gloeocapsopsis dulcis]|uniref:General secretion pathway protein GspH n=1 Tax=Gloeocapsopsis dulcis AAB1 = 1H9 TaxID=1433147 RepID=A0A6N8FTA3_9CHRO|nr:type IV pilin-like G/H family protein [Gloeocapsopsis dulcis]MUL35555.1 general secretion pathway protein GspH [Gloeocapsopsis dulcis AAB1 = 1H9]WNN87542.1 type IV pilin-like G/H family protein [Gloeocapsopsis dulcis]
MKTELKVKFLQHLNQKKKSEGFTLIELLVVIIIIGILSAIALPSFLNQASKARQSEARTNVGALNRAQQSFYLENQSFSDNLSNLGIGISNSDNYNYEANGNNLGNQVANLATSSKPDLKEYAGGVFKTGDTTASILCEGNNSSVNASAPTNASNCGTNQTKL